MNDSNRENPAILNNFLEYLTNVRRYSITTVKEYRIDLMLFFKFIKDYFNINIEIGNLDVFILLGIKQADIIAFIVYLNYNRNCTATTRKRKICAIKAFYKWLFSIYPTGNIINPTEDLPVIQNIEKLPKYLNLEKVKQLKQIFNYNNSKFPVRNNTIISIFLSCGLRASELININIRDLNLNNKSIKIIGKNDKERLVYFNDNIKKQIEKYLKVRNANKEYIDIDEPLFLSYRNGRLNLRSVEKITKNAYELAGLSDFNYTTHTLRHTTATMIYQYVTQDILVIKEILGHATVKSTEIYTHVHNDEIKKAFDSNPLANFIPSKAA